MRDSRYWIPDSLSVEPGFRILILILVSLSLFPNSKSQDSRMHKQKISLILESGFSNIEWVITRSRKNHLQLTMVWSFLSQQQCCDKPSQTRCRCLWCDCLPQSNPLNIDTIDAGCLVSTLHVCVRSWVCMIFGTKTVALKREVSVL